MAWGCCTAHGTEMHATLYTISCYLVYHQTVSPPVGTYGTTYATPVVHCCLTHRFAAAFYCYGTYMPSFLAANVPGMSRNLALGSTLVHLICTMFIAWSVGWLCDKGMPRMIFSGVIYIVAGEGARPDSTTAKLGHTAKASSARC